MGEEITHDLMGRVFFLFISLALKVPTGGNEFILKRFFFSFQPPNLNMEFVNLHISINYYRSESDSSKTKNYKTGCHYFG